MPKLTGPEAALILRNKIGYHQPIIGVTGNTLSEDVNLFISSGATQVLSKPVNKKDIQNVLKRKFRFLKITIFLDNCYIIIISFYFI